MFTVKQPSRPSQLPLPPAPSAPTMSMEERRRGLAQNPELYSAEALAPQKPEKDTYGKLPAVPVGSTWRSRADACAAGVHRHTQAGILAGPHGAYSICASGKYGDKDTGLCLIYSGTGGQSADHGNPTGHPFEDQSADHPMNASLIKSAETRNPVRVLRGSHNSPWAPESGYRYDGLYRVVDWHTEKSEVNKLTGKQYQMLKFELRRLAGQPPLVKRGST